MSYNVCDVLKLLTTSKSVFKMSKSVPTLIMLADITNFSLNHKASAVTANLENSKLSLKETDVIREGNKTV